MNWLIPILLLLLGAPAPDVPSAHACRCLIEADGIGGAENRSTTIEQEAGRDQIIFAGRVVGYADFSTGDMSGTLGYEFEVEELFFAADGSTPDTVIVRSTIGPFACGVSFEEGERALVYASAISETERVYFTSTCHRTLPLAGTHEEWEQDQLARLRALVRR